MSYLSGAYEIRRLFDLETTRPEPVDWAFLQHEALHGVIVSFRHRHQLEVTEKERAFFLQSVAYQMRCAQLLKTLSERLPDLRLVVFKGSALAYGVYTEPGQRTFGDVDLAVPREGLERVGQVLTDLDFRATRVAGEYVKNGLLVDLHTHPLEKLEPLFQPEADRWWDRLEPLSAQTGGVLRLSYEDEFVLVLVHGVKHSFSRLNWLIDLALLARHVERERLLESLGRHRAARQLAYAQALMLHFYGVEVLPDWRWDRPFDWLERKFLARVQKREPSAFLGKLLCLRSAPSWRVAASFFLRNLFPEESPMNQRLWNLIRMFFSLARR